MATLLVTMQCSHEFCPRSAISRLKEPDENEAKERAFCKHRKNLAYIYFEDKPGRRSAAKLLTRDEAQGLVARSDRLGTAKASAALAHAMR